jgi:eukaryotic-like serine/threonine-protein kinase
MPVMTRLAFASGDGIVGTELDYLANAGRPSRTAFAISRAGDKLVYTGERNGVRQLFMRSLSGETATAIPGTEDAESPFFSPDGSWIAYWARGRLMRVPVAGGEPVQIAEMTRIRGGDWYEDRIVVGDNNSGLILLAATGATKSDTLAGPRATLPKFMPGGKVIVFSQRFGPAQQKLRLEAITIASRKRKHLIDDASDGRFVATGHLVFARDGKLMAVPFDARRLSVTAQPIVMLNDIMQSLNGSNVSVQTGAMQVVISDAGHLLYLTGGVTPDRARQLVWLDRQGNKTPIMAAGIHPFFAVRLSPDEKKIAATLVGWEPMLHVFDLARGMGHSIKDPGRQLWPLWSPDGRRIIRNGIVGDSGALVWSWADGSRPAESIVKNRIVDGGPAFWSVDGSELFVQGGTAGGLRAVNIATGAIRTIANVPGTFSFPALSPDGKWLAYSAAEAGSDKQEVYVQPWPALDRRWKVSTDGGAFPKWTRNGAELVYGTGIDSDSAGQPLMRIMAATVEPGPDFSVQAPRQLFIGEFNSTTNIRSFDVTADGSRFLVIMGQRTKSPPGELRFVANWTSELKRLSTQGKL